MTYEYDKHKPYPNSHAACPACGRPVQRCVECNKVFYPNRPDAQCCGSACRVHRSRRLEKAKRAAARAAAASA